MGMDDAVEDDVVSTESPILGSLDAGADPGASPIPPEVNLDPSTWEGWANTYMIWIAQNPWQFLYYVLICLTPFFFISMLLSWKLAKAIEAQEKDRKRSARRGANLAKTRRAKSD